MPRPVPLTPEQRSLAARLAAYASHAAHHPDTRLAAARRANPTFVDCWLDRVRAEHPDLDEVEVARRASLRHREHMARLALAAARARAARKAAGQ